MTQAPSRHQACIGGTTVPAQRHFPQVGEEFCGAPPARKAGSDRKAPEGVCRGACRNRKGTCDASTTVSVLMIDDLFSDLQYCEPQQSEPFASQEQEQTGTIVVVEL
ncbi:hypothetical protein NDU88_007185 [Pleurodeles waltl]|uniref:Uncharacterized protein n=1 Tax=Pleurodeles waltl TaxID=8319 RepID=A0AAV7VQ00_PLEWA|nr:hypothetical protein NDU88_007185 [Pleurodeles waltl]